MNETYNITLRQLGTSETSAAAMLDVETEAKLYRLFRDFFRDAEEQRSWNVWNDISWDGISTAPPTELAAAVFAAYREDLFLPDYSSKSLHVLRASRGRAWFWTHWCYEEGKHLLVLIEWLTRSGAYTDEALRQYTDEQLVTYRWEPPVRDALGVFWDTLLWERREIDRWDALLPLAQSAEDAALVGALTKIRADEVAHRDFVQASLRIIQEKYADRVREAAEKVATANRVTGGANELLRYLD